MDVTRGRADDALVWFFNVAVSVMIVFVNKMLMDPSKGHGFVFATNLCALHLFASAAAVKALQLLGVVKAAKMPMYDILLFSLMGGTSVASLNLSLLVNSVGFYQITKLLIIPFVCLVEFAWLGRRLRRLALLAILLVTVGVAIVTASDLSGGQLSLQGGVVAGVSVVSSGMQQILCGMIQRRNRITANQMLLNTAPVQGLMLLSIGPSLDHVVGRRWLLDYSLSLPAAQCLALSCAVAVLVNISQFMCLGRFHAVTFQVLGQTKTVLVLFMGWLFLNDVVTPHKLLGITLAVAGIAGYGFLS